uniref:Uncharacterized protein n=1 Tax=uncultured Rhodospirillales bacterium HF4000_24M03 TaxID=710788 RepID=E0XW13_9PROT|nr:hypothetical protein [uncultured Rhodospirillales bacterium HF4000_24M03]
MHFIAIGDAAFQDQAGDRILQDALHDPLQRPGAIDGVVPGIAQPRRRRAIEFERDIAAVEQGAQPVELNIDDRFHMRPGQPVEQQDFIQPVEEFRPEGSPHNVHHRLPHGAGILALGLIGEDVATQIGGHHDQCILEIDQPPLPIGQPPVIEYLEQDVENIGMGFFDLVEQDDLIGPAADCFGQRAAFVVSDIAGRRPDQPGDRMYFHIFRHVDADHGGFVVEQELGQSAGQFSFADAGRPQEQERANRPARVL